MGQAWWETQENGRTHRYKMEKQLREEKWILCPFWQDTWQHHYNEDQWTVVPIKQFKMQYSDVDNKICSVTGSFFFQENEKAWKNASN